MIWAKQEQEGEMNRQGIRPGFRIGLDLPMREGYRRVMPFRRSWKAIVILLVLDAIFLLPAWGAANHAMNGWSGFDSLFDLVTAIFMSAWLMGWSVAPILITLVLVLLAFGREVLRVSKGRVELFIGIPLLGLCAVYDPRAMRNLQLQQAPQKSGHSWRKSYLSFDYGANQGEFGSGITAEEASEIKLGLELAAGTVIRGGRATAAELEGHWEPGKAAEFARELMQPEDGKSKPEIAQPHAVNWSSPSNLFLIVANLVPVFGAALLGWNLGDVMVLYWCESAIIGFFNLCKLVVVSRWMALLTVPFFLAHFSAFMAVHFLFIYTLFVEGPQASSSSGGDLQQVSLMFVMLWPALLALFVSHGYSFLSNFIGQHEFQARDSKEQMAEPYKRIVFMHLVLIFGGGLSLVMGNSTPVLLVVIAVKIWVDVKAHIKEHAVEAVDDQLKPTYQPGKNRIVQEKGSRE